MSGQIDPSVLRRKIGQATAVIAEVPVTASRAMRLAVTRAAERTVGLQLTVNGVSEEVLSLEGVQSALRDDVLMLKLVKHGELVGVLGLDAEFIAAIVEVQTTGGVGAAAPDQRSITLIDIMLTEPMITGLFAQLAETTPQTALDGWTVDVAHADRFADVRAIGLSLSHVDYRLMRMNVDLGGGDRSGELLLALPSGKVAVPEPIAPPPSGKLVRRPARHSIRGPGGLICDLAPFRNSTSYRKRFAGRAGFTAVGMHGEFCHFGWS